MSVPHRLADLQTVTLRNTVQSCDNLRILLLLHHGQRLIAQHRLTPDQTFGPQTREPQGQDTTIGHLKMFTFCSSPEYAESRPRVESL